MSKLGIGTGSPHGWDRLVYPKSLNMATQLVPNRSESKNDAEIAEL